MRSLSIIYTLVNFLFYPVFGQVYLLDSESSSMKIKGTSSLHNWESNVEEFLLTIEKQQSIWKKVNGKIVVKSIKSGKGIMDDKTYDALQGEKYPYIDITSSDISELNGKITGNIQLKIAGKSRSIAFSSNINSDQQKLQVLGEVPIKMSDFGISPPTAMFGTLTTGDEVIIQYNLNFKISNNP